MNRKKIILLALLVSFSSLYKAGALPLSWESLQEIILSAERYRDEVLGTSELETYSLETSAPETKTYETGSYYPSTLRKRDFAPRLIPRRTRTSKAGRFRKKRRKKRHEKRKQQKRVHELPDLFPILKEQKRRRRHEHGHNHEHKHGPHRCAICLEEISDPNERGCLNCCAEGRNICDKCVREYVCPRRYKIQRDETDDPSAHPHAISYEGEDEAKRLKFQRARPHNCPRHFLWFNVDGIPFFWQNEDPENLWHFTGETGQESTDDWRWVQLPKCPVCRRSVIAQILQLPAQARLTRRDFVRFLQTHR